MTNPSPRAATGRIAVHLRGFGFFNEDPPSPEALSAFVAPPALNAFLADDRVTATLVPTADGRWSATELKLVERVRSELVGEVVLHRGGLHLRIDREVANTDWALDAGTLTVGPGDHVVAKVMADGKARALRRLESADERALAQVIARHAIPTTFDDAAVAQARDALNIPHAVERFRRDLRDVPTLTIDAPSTRDIDDALSVIPSPDDGAVRLLVSIADVSAFVPEGSPLDLAARDRATSVYLAGRVVPMFPEELSATWASLLAREDRCCLTAELRIDPEGTVTSVDVYESVIRSASRATYDEVAAFLDRGEVSENLEPLHASLPWLRTVSARIGLSRARRGGVEISREETRIVFDAATGVASAIESVRPTSAHALIERCMVAANEAIARWLVERGVPGMYRVHDEPDPERVRDLSAFAHNFGFEAGFARKLTPLALTAFDHQISGSPVEPALRSVLLRSLGVARYTVHPSMHFGLAAPLYLHFTSPIRRYADLAVHRIVKRYLHGERAYTVEDPAIERLAEHINQRARAASRAENDRRRMLTAAFMAGHIGEVFSARVTRVRPFGLIAQIDTTQVEGTLPFDKLPGAPYTIDDRESSATSETRSFAIGLPVRVKVVASDASTGRIEFALVEDAPTPAT
jgi:ribonuclease R